jgi:hypothetical protein
MDSKEFKIRFPAEKGIYVSTSQVMVAYAADWSGPHPVQRRITYKCFPSRHECNAKCLNGKHDGTCECKCGGVNHGLGNILNAA